MLLFSMFSAYADEEVDVLRITELDSYWAEVSRAVEAGDFEAYSATCHPEGVLVSGKKKVSYPLVKALSKWKSEFDDTKAKKIKASAEFRFSKRIGDATSAHETGMLLYTSTDAEGKVSSAYVHLEALLVKREGKWLILMEYQKSEGSKKEWDELAK
ncbi:MAG: hypothetical protein ACSHX6_14495 [Akkermansiaceae bacterium]